MESAIHTRLICFILVVIKDYESAFDGVTTKAKGPLKIMAVFRVTKLGELCRFVARLLPKANGLKSHRQLTALFSHLQSYILPY